jgi:hypothetical protein
MYSIFSRHLCEASRRRTGFTDGGSLQLIARQENPTKGVRPHLKTTLPADQTLLSRCGVRPLGYAGDIDRKRIELDKPCSSI